MTDYTFDFTDMTEVEFAFMAATLSIVMGHGINQLAAHITIFAAQSGGLSIQEVKELPPGEILNYIQAFNTACITEIKRRVAVLDNDTAPVVLDDIWTRWQDDE